jgi:hypothetical protein
LRFSSFHQCSPRARLYLALGSINSTRSDNIIGMRVFISHITEESPLALVLKDWIESTFAGQCEVFVSSDLANIPAGSRWLEEIDDALNSSVAFLVLCSPISLPRPWINFETRCGWIKRVPIIPICHSGQKKNTLPTPISLFQGLEMDSPNFTSDFFSSLSKHTGILKLPRIDHQKMAQEIRASVDSIVKKPKQKQAVRAEGHQDVALDQSALIILKCLATSIGDKYNTLESFSRVTRLHYTKVLYYLDILIDEVQFVTWTQRPGLDRLYHLTKEGRKFLVDKKLL